MVRPAYGILHAARPGKRAGDIVVLFKEGLSENTDNHQGDVFTCFKHTECSVKTGKTQMRICLIYFPPTSRKNGFSITKFLDELTLFTKQLCRR